MLLNAFTRAWTAAPVAFPILIASGTFMLIYESATTYTAIAGCQRCAASVHDHAAACYAGWIMCSALAGISAGGIGTRQLRALATSAWLTPLPWAEPARNRAVSVAGAAYGTALATGLAIAGWAGAHAIGVANAALVAATGAAGFGVPFAAATCRAMVSPGTRRTAERTTAAGGTWLLDPADRGRPTHVGRWAMAGRTRGIAFAWVICLLVLVPSSAAASLAQHNDAVALAVAALGAHAIFILALRCRPLQAAALRATPLGFAAAATALCRVPLTLSLSVFAIAALFPCAADPAARTMLPAAFAALSLCNALYAAAALARPASMPQAMLLHGAGLYAVVYEAASAGVAYGALTLLVVCMIATLLVRQARRQFRAFHG